MIDTETGEIYDDKYFMDDEWSPEVILDERNPGRVANEAEMMELGDKYEQASLEYAALASSLARADAEYHNKYYTAMMNMASGISPAEKRKAVASLEAKKEYYHYRLLQERQKAFYQYMQSLKMKIDIERTISANMRNN